MLLSVVAFFERHLHFQCGFVYVSSENADFTQLLAWVSMLGVSHIDSILFSFKAKQKEKEQENEMLQSVNAMIEKNYEIWSEATGKTPRISTISGHHVMAPGSS